MIILLLDVILEGWRVVTHLTGDDNHICLFGGCLLITYVPRDLPSLNVNTPAFEMNIERSELDRKLIIQWFQCFVSCLFFF